MMKLGVALCLLVGLVASAPLKAAEVEEPQDYRTDNYRAPTPATVNGEKGLSTEEAHALWSAGQAVFVDVLPHPPRPANLPPGTVFHEKIRTDIPHSIWLPDTGYGGLAPPTEAYLRHGLQQATQGHPDRPLVFYCLQQCWMSWNAAKRAMSLGYTHVFWYPDGTDGWAKAGFPLELRVPEPRDDAAPH